MKYISCTRITIQEMTVSVNLEHEFRWIKNWPEIHNFFFSFPSSWSAWKIGVCENTIVEYWALLIETENFGGKSRDGSLEEFSIFTRNSFYTFYIMLFEIARSRWSWRRKLNFQFVTTLDSKAMKWQVKFHSNPNNTTTMLAKWLNWNRIVILYWTIYWCRMVFECVVGFSDAL